MKHLPRLTVSKRNAHLLETTDRNPFLMIGDTAWELFHRLTLDEIEEYLAVRSEQGFNMVWANILPEFDGLRTPNQYGELPLVDLDPTRPNERYFEFIDQVVALASDYGIYLGLLPAWGDKLTAPWGAGPKIFRQDNLNVAYAYCDWLGGRYRETSNIVWVLGGDRPARMFGDENYFPGKNAKEAGLDLNSDWTPIWRTMASALKTAGASQLMTYHPQGGAMSTSVFLHEEEWLDLNAMQSGHGGGHDVPVWDSIERDYRRLPTKPTFDSEPNYEDHPVNPWPIWDPATGFFDDFDVRKQVYRSIFAGGCGVIYGNHCVWQFASELFEPVLEVMHDWRTALRQPGAAGMIHLISLLRSVDFLGLTPDQSRIISDACTGGSHARAIRSATETLVYVPDGRPIEIDLSWANETKVSIEEFNPIDGTYHLLNQPEIGFSSAVCPPVLAPRDRVIVIRSCDN